MKASNIIILGGLGYLFFSNYVNSANDLSVSLEGQKNWKTEGFKIKFQQEISVLNPTSQRITFQGGNVKVSINNTFINDTFLNQNIVLNSGQDVTLLLNCVIPITSFISILGSISAKNEIRIEGKMRALGFFVPIDKTIELNIPTFILNLLK